MGAKGSTAAGPRAAGEQAGERQRAGAKRFSTFRRSSSDARLQLERTLKGGLNRDLLDFLWMQQGGLADKSPDALHDVVKAVVRDYPALFAQAVELSFRAYAKSPDAMPSAATQRRMTDELRPVLATMRATLDGMGSRARHSLVRSAVQRSAAREGRSAARVPFATFAAAFEETAGPWLAGRLMQKEYRRDLLDTFAARTQAMLVPQVVAVEAPRSPRDHSVRDSAGAPRKSVPYYKRAFSFRNRKGRPSSADGSRAELSDDDDTPTLQAPPRRAKTSAPEADRRRRSKRNGAKAPPRRAQTTALRRSGSVQEH